MESEMIIFLAIASLAQSTYVPNLTVDYGLSTADAAILKEIIIYQEEAKVAHIEATKYVFDILGNLIAAYIAASDASISSTAVSEGLCRAKNASDVTFDSVLVALETSCSTVTTAKTEAYEILEAAFSSIESALELATCEDYADDQADIESYETLVLGYFQNLTDLEFSTISTCLDFTDSAIASLLDVALEASLTSTSQLTEAIFNGIKVYAATASGSYPYVSATCDIEVYRDKASIANRNHNEQKFAVLRTIFINANLGQDGIVDCVAESQYTDIVSLRAYMDGNVVLFKEISDALTGIELGLGDDGDTYYPRGNVSLATVAAQFDQGDFRVNDDILFIHPENSTAIAALRALIHSLNVLGDVAFYNAFRLSANKSIEYSVAAAAIETQRRAAVDPAPEYTGLFFDAIRGNTTLSSTIQADLVSLQNLTTYGAQVSTNRFLDGCLVLLNATQAGEVTDADFETIATYLLEAFAALEYFSQGLAAAGLLVCNYINGS